MAVEASESDELKRKTIESLEKVETRDEVGSRFALSAGGTPAIPPFAINAGGTPAIPPFALSAGGTPAVPTPALPINGSSARTTSQTPNQTQGSKQTTTNPYVFPTPKERFNRYVKSVVGPSALLRSALTAGINQWNDSPEEWEQGMSGYGKRYASSFGRNAIQHTIIYGLDSALGLDTGFKKSTRKGFFPRMKDALAYNIMSRTKSGKRVISVPRITGAYASGVISREAWYPERYNYKDGLRSGTNSLLTGFAYNLVREFVVSF